MGVSLVDKPLRPCAVPGCPVLHRTGCPVHSTTNGGRRSPYDHEWRKVRDAFLAAHPWCWCGALAREVDHLIPIRMGGARLDPANLRSLCHPHHSAVTAITRARMNPPRPFRKRLPAIGRRR
jgi:5-methylcytosine-specific restriction protein A